MERSILIHFDKTTGEVRVEAEGFEGLPCLEATQPFEEALGVVGDRTFKDEVQTQSVRTNPLLSLSEYYE
ncbi:hypothetical protein NOS3756_55870 (plasmid) [Nostoc sp. NIES-3756]|uniref:DUF2997 domain-containing protein n=1 Tax=Nostoc sp. NIES-3756 TaxID=1751286 RepID=UPI00071EB97A|nr:DUF2997 domain-containing protein [Nostoc sp. NIES-3756]BAT56575.1 hypothetical protein NOS3756_55870 [Nostoc sp. NIES-3756]